MHDFEYTHRKLKKSLYIYLADTRRCGLGIFTAKAFQGGDVVMTDDDGDYYDNVVSYAGLTALGINLGMTLQVSLDGFKLPNGNLDDFTNHSCDPNTGIRLTKRGFIILALRDIRPHEELTYDYSTHLNNPYEAMSCHCGAATCRGVIGNFRTLPEELQRKYRALGVAADFVLEPVPARHVAAA